MVGKVTASLLALGVVLAPVSGCGGAPASTHNVRVDVGGSVVYALDPGEGLAGVSVGLADVEGEIETATTNSAGLWTIENLRPGVYTETYSLAGYEPFVGTFAIPAGGENNVKNVFLTRPEVALSEVGLVASISPFDVEVRDGDEPHDGLAGASMTYSSSAGGAIVVTFDRRIASGTVRLRDTETDQQISATSDALDQVFTFSEAQISTLNGGGPNGHLTVDSDPFTWHRIDINVNTYTPIHGDLVHTSARIWFNAVP